MKKPLRRILIINPFEIGDVLFSMSLVEAIKQAIPDATIGFFCNERTQDLVKLNASIQRAHVFNRGLLRRLWKTDKGLFFREFFGILEAIKLGGYDAVFDLSLGRQYSFFSMLLGIGRRIGFDFKGRGLFLTDKLKLEGYEKEFVAKTQLRLLEFLDLPGPSADRDIPIEIPIKFHDQANLFCGHHGFSPRESWFAVAPGGGKSWGQDAVFKQWNPERFAEVIRQIGEKTGLKAVLLGDQSEEGLLKRVADLSRTASLVVSGQPLGVVSSLLQRSQFLIGNDGGLMHLANALRVKTVGIFGPVDEHVYGPHHTNTPSRVLAADVPCRPCYQKFHFPPCAYQRQCLEKVPIERVVEAVESIL